MSHEWFRRTLAYLNARCTLPDGGSTARPDYSSETQDARELTGRITNLELTTDDTLEGILEDALEVAEAPLGMLQLVDPRAERLKIRVSRGLMPSVCHYYDTIERGEAAACVEAFRCRRRILVEDITTSSFYERSQTLSVLLSAGVRAVQATPLIAPAGEPPVGVLSTFWREPHRPDGEQLQSLEASAHLGAELIEQKSRAVASVPEAEGLEARWTEADSRFRELKAIFELNRQRARELRAEFLLRDVEFALRLLETAERVGSGARAVGLIRAARKACQDIARLRFDVCLTPGQTQQLDTQWALLFARLNELKAV